MFCRYGSYIPFHTFVVEEDFEELTIVVYEVLFGEVGCVVGRVVMDDEGPKLRLGDYGSEEQELLGYILSVPLGRPDYTYNKR